MTDPDLFKRAAQYASRCGCVLEKPLGYGFDGTVFSTNRQSAVKVFKYERLYRRELDVYSRLRHHSVTHLRQFAVPELVGSDDELWIVEMTIVRPPFVLDFAGAYLDRPPDYPHEVMEQWRADKAEQFEDRWPEVQRVMREFAAWGIYLADVKPGNIEFDD
jgi:hypothetical protein